jgi:hypothetical protein
MPGAHTNSLDRAMNALTIGTVKDLAALEEQRRLDGLQEVEEQYQILVSGNAEEFAAWQYVEVRFGLVFIDGTGQRDSDLVRPHFTYGAEMFTATPVALQATVMEWVTNNRNETIGAKLAIGVMATDVATRFRAALHAAFQGWGQPANTFPDDVG